MPTRITVSLPEREHAELAALARKYDVSLSWLMRKAVTEFLAQCSKEEAHLTLKLPSKKKVEQ